MFRPERQSYSTVALSFLYLDAGTNNQAQAGHSKRKGKRYISSVGGTSTLEEAFCFNWVPVTSIKTFLLTYFVLRQPILPSAGVWAFNADM